jgi:flagellin-like protein
MRDCRGQSELIGLVVVFAVVVSAIGIVTATGFAGLQDARAVEETNNGVRAMEILAHNIDDVVFGNAPARATEIDLADTQLDLGEPVTIHVRHLDSNGTTVEYSLETAPIDYRLDGDTRLVYVGGSVIRVERDGAVQLRGPPTVQSDHGTTIPIVALRGPTQASVGGDRSVLVRAHHAKTDVLVADPPLPLEIEVVSATPAISETYVDGLPCDDVTASGPTSMTCVIDSVEAVSITAVRIDVAFE